jgi:hypothetical protein
MPNSNALDPQSPHARDLRFGYSFDGFCTVVFYHDLSRNSFGQGLDGLT